MISLLAAATDAPATGSGSSGLLQLLVYLVLLAGILAAGFHFLKNGVPGLQRKLIKTDRKLQLSEMRSLGGRQFLVVAEYESKKVLIGVCPGRIDYLCELSSGSQLTKD